MERVMHPVRPVIVLFAAVLLSTPGATSASTGENGSRPGDALLAADRAFAAAARDTDMLDALSAQFADSVVMPAGAGGLAEGRSAVVEALQARPGVAGARVDWSAVGVGISADGRQGYTYGFMQQTGADASEAPLKYLAYWKQEDEGWRVIAYRLARRAAGEVDRSVRHHGVQDSRQVPPADPAARDAAAKSLADAERAFSDEAQRVGLQAAFARFGIADSMNMGGANAADFVRGATDIAQAVSVGQPPGGSSLHWGPVRVVVADSGDLGLSIGYIRHNQPDAEGKPLPPIPFFTVWRRAAPDQPWRYVAE
jgi:ketosteroid isomerase-like protein